MKVRCVSIAFVSAAFLAAFAMNGSPAIASSSSSSLKLTRDAYQALQAGDSDLAIAKYTKAINSGQLEPEVLANALLNRALGYQQAGNDERALADYTEALSLDAMAPALRATALYNRGLSQHKIGNLQAAIADFTGALLLNDEFAHAFYSRGNALRDSGQLLFALSDYDRALRYKHPDPSKVKYGEALTYMALRRPLDAKKALHSVLAEKPGHAGALDHLAKLDASGENSSSAESEADPILTGSVAAIVGQAAAGTEPALPQAADVPAHLLPSAAKPKRAKIQDRLPETQSAQLQPAVQTDEAVEEPRIELASVPEIPEPEVVDQPQLDETTATVEPVEEPQATTSEPDAVSEPPAQATAQESETASGWQVQLASASTEDAAWSTWKKMQRSKKVLQKLNPIVVRADLGAKGVFYRVRLTGFDGQSDAKSACGKLKAAGVSCYISKS